MQRPIAAPTFILPDLYNPRQLEVQLKRFLSDFAFRFNTATQGAGVALASASTIKPSSFMHHVTGTTTIDTISVPPGFTGPLVLIADDGFDYTDSDNIATPGSVAADKAIMFIWENNLWYPISVGDETGQLNFIALDSVFSTSSAVFSTITDGTTPFSYPLAANELRAFRMVASIFRSAGSGNFTFGVNIPAGATVRGLASFFPKGGALTSAVIDTDSGDIANVAPGALNNICAVVFDFFVVNGGTPGNVEIQLRSISSGTFNVEVGSFMQTVAIV